MTSDYAGLYRAILEVPYDDAPRGAIADVLDDAGAADRARFVRIGLELAMQRDPARRPPASEANDRRQDRLELNSRRLLKRWAVGRTGCNAIHWLGTLPGFAHPFANVSKRRCYTGWAPSAPQDLAPRDGTTAADYVYATFRRGFVDEVALPLRAFYGDERPCPNVEDATTCPETNALECCSECEHTGVIGEEGIAAALFAAHPITRVRLTDVVPVRLDRWRNTSPTEIAVERYHVWEFPVGERRDGLPTRLPWDIYDHMDHGVTHGEWTSEESALESLSHGCVRYGRRLAGLPDLPADAPSRLR